MLAEYSRGDQAALDRLLPLVYAELHRMARRYMGRESPAHSLQPLAPTTIKLRLAAVRRFAYEAADSGLLSPELGASIRRVKRVRRIGVRLGNWLTADQGRSLLLKAAGENLRSKRNYATLALLVGCGLRRSELLALTMRSVQLREDHWVIADLHGKAG